MLINELFFGPFKSKYEKGIYFVEDIYDDDDFSGFYQSLETGFYDNEFYENTLEHDGKVLEIGSGTGRIVRYLTKKGFDIYGLEPSEKMRSFIEEEYKDKIYPFGIEDIEKISGMKFKSVIIPATTVSLFKFDVFEQFLINLKKILAPDAKVYFDFWDEEYVNELHEKVETIKYKDTTVYLGNHIKGDSLIFNIYINIENNAKLGLSKKNIYSRNIIKNICEKIGYNVEFDNIYENIVLARLTNGIL